MRKPIRPNPQKQRVTRAYTVPAAVGGLNARESISNMPETDCIIATNVICDTDAIRIRPGHKIHASGMNGNVESLMEWSGPGATAKLFAACASSNSVFECTTATAGVSAIAGAGETNARWQHIVFGNGVGTNYLVMCNGADPVKNFDGTTWTEPTIAASGTTSSKFMHVTEHAERLWFTESSSTAVWYLPVNSIAGTAKKFDFGPLLTLGGYISSCFAWTLDSGSGMDDLFCAYSSRGEVIVYQGNDPGSAQAWAKTGTFRMSAPIGRRNFFQVGSDVILITQSGFMPLSKGLLSGQTVQQEAISDKIRDLVRKSTTSSGSFFGWQPILYPKRALGIFNIPTVEGSSQAQFIINTLNLSWAKWEGLQANCWSLLGDDIYFGGKDGVVYEFGTTAASITGTVQADVKPAFSYMGDRTGLKQFHMARPIIVSTASVSPVMVMNVDYNDFAPTQTPSINFTGGDWDVTSWDNEYWAGTEFTNTNWVAVTGNGFAGTLRWRAITSQSEISWHATDYLWEPGEYM